MDAARPPRTLSPEWLAAMLLDVTSHLMNAADRQARLREPLERIANAVDRPRRAPALRLAIAAGFAAAIAFGGAIVIRPMLHRSDAADVKTIAADGAIEVTFAGIRYRATRAEFEHRIADASPEPIHEYSVVVGRRRFPVKQAVSVGLGAPRSEFRSDQAIRVLGKLGYDVQSGTEFGAK